MGNIEEIVREAPLFSYSDYENEKQTLLEQLREGKDPHDVLRSASHKILDNGSFLLECLGISRKCFKHASERLRCDRKFLLYALEIDGSLFKDMNETIRGEKEIANQAVKLSPENFIYMSNTLQLDRDFVLELVKINGGAVRFVSPKFLSDPEIVTEALKNVSPEDSIEDAFDDVEFDDKKDLKILLDAVEENPDILDRVKGEILMKEDFFLDCMKRNADAFHKFPNEFFSRHNSFFATDPEDFDCEIGDDMCWAKIADEVLRISRQQHIKLSEFDLKTIDLMLSDTKTRKTNISLPFGMNIQTVAKKPDIVREGKELMEKREELVQTESFKNLKFCRLLGRGAYASAYLCRFDGFVVVAKVYQENIMGEQKRQSMERDSLYTPYHPNVAFIFGQKGNQFIDLTSLPDYEDNWKEDEESETTDYGMVITKYHHFSLSDYLKFTDEKFSSANYSWKVESRVCQSTNPSSPIGDEDLDFERLGCFSPICFCGILDGIIKGSHHLFENKIVHRDLHSGNVFIDPSRSRIWIGDFGCALDLRTNPTGFNVPKDDPRLLNAPSYTGGCAVLNLGGESSIPPEIEEDSKHDDILFLNFEKFDVYSLGLLVRQVMSVFTKHLSFWAKIRKTTAESEDTDVTDVVFEGVLIPFVDSMLEKNPHRRIGSKIAMITFSELIKEWDLEMKDVCDFPMERFDQKVFVSHIFEWGMGEDHPVMKQLKGLYGVSSIKELADIGAFEKAAVTDSDTGLGDRKLVERLLENTSDHLVEKGLTTIESGIMKIGSSVLKTFGVAEDLAENLDSQKSLVKPEKMKNLAKKVTGSVMNGLFKGVLDEMYDEGTGSASQRNNHSVESVREDLKCPFCLKDVKDLMELRSHCQQFHSSLTESNIEVKCPLCKSLQKDFCVHLVCCTGC